MNSTLNNLRLLPLLALTSILITGCASTGRDKTFIPAAVANGESVLYIYRPGGMSNAMYQPLLVIDGEAQTEMVMGRHYRYRLPPGHHRVELSMSNANFQTAGIELTTRPGQIRYFSIQSELGLDSTAAGYAPYRRQFSLQAVEKNQARDEISDCCMTQTKQEPDSGHRNADKPKTEGFSPDITQNPFGH